MDNMAEDILNLEVADAINKQASILMKCGIALLNENTPNEFLMENTDFEEAKSELRTEMGSRI